MLEKELRKIISNYETIVKEIDEKATGSSDRAYGGVIRSGKGTLVEDMAKSLVEIAWITILKQDKKRLFIDKSKIKIGTKDGYEDRITNEDVKKYVIDNKDSLVYKFGTDVHVYIDERLVIPIECKAYTENAMIKRILFDAVLMKEAKNIDKYFLLQLESQLGGDYSNLNPVTYGSASTHALMSHVDVDLEIITLLEGERLVKQPIHKSEFYKPLTMESLKKGVNIFAEELKKYV